MKVAIVIHLTFNLEGMKKKEFTIKSESINQENDIHMTFLLEIKLQKYIF